MKRILLIALLLYCVTIAKAQSIHMLVKPLTDPVPLSATVIYYQGTHEVVLTYTASSDAAANPTLSYKVYKALATCASNPNFTFLVAVAAGVLTDTDTAVSVGQTIAYTVTSVLNGVEGVPSNCAQAVIPPAPPSGLNAKGS